MTQMMSTTRSCYDHFRMSRIRVLEPEGKDRMNEDIIRVFRSGLFGGGEGSMKIGTDFIVHILLLHPPARP
jgi:hypothetical protein